MNGLVQQMRPLVAPENVHEHDARKNALTSTALDQYRLDLTMSLEEAVEGLQGSLHVLHALEAQCTVDAELATRVLNRTAQTADFCSETIAQIEEHLAGFVQELETVLSSHGTTTHTFSEQAIGSLSVHEKRHGGEKALVHNECMLY